MPSYVSHYLLQTQMNFNPKNEAEQFMYTYGVQGGDILFQNAHNLKYIGTAFHRQKVYKSLFEMKKYVYEKNDSDLIAYFKAYICHFALDSIIHPYVYDCEQHYHDTVDSSLQPYPIHMRVEANIDELLLEKLENKTIYDIDPAQLFKTNEQSRKKLADMFSFLALKVFDEAIDSCEIETAFNMYADSAVHTKCPTQKDRQALIESGLLPHNDFIELCQPCPAMTDYDYMNEKKRSWRHMQTGEISNDSVAQMFDKAVIYAKELTKKLDKAQSMDEVKEIINMKNFLGNRE